LEQIQSKLGQDRNSKITFDFAQLLEKFPKYELFTLKICTTFVLVTSQDSKYILK